MTCRVLTVNREFGSGGGYIAQRIAEQLGWKLLDKDIIDAIAYAAHVDPKVVKRYDEHVEGWLRRLNQQAMRGAALAAGIELADNAVIDAEEMVKISQKVIEQAYQEGNAVIVGRGAQCVLQNRPDVFHVFVYGPCQDRVERLKQRLAPSVNLEQKMKAIDAERAKYLQQYYGKNWLNMHLYDLMVSSHQDEAQTARVILAAMLGGQN